MILNGNNYLIRDDTCIKDIFKQLLEEVFVISGIMRVKCHPKPKAEADNTY